MALGEAIEPEPDIEPGAAPPGPCWPPSVIPGELFAVGMEPDDDDGIVLCDMELELWDIELELWDIEL